MNECLLESENFQITKSDNNKYLLLPVKKQPAEKIVLKECGKDKMNNFAHKKSQFTTQKFHVSLIYFVIKTNSTRKFKSQDDDVHTLITCIMCYHRKS